MAERDGDPLGEYPELVTVADVADYLKLTSQGVIGLIKRGDLVALKPPGMRGYRIPREAFEEYLEAGYSAVAAEVDAEAVLEVD